MDRLAIVMTAGEGIRMCSTMPKVLHQVCGIPMVEHVMRALESVCREQVLIVGSARERLTADYKGRVEFVQQAGTGRGTGWAVMCAVDKLEGRTGVVVVTPGDKPLIQSETYARLVSEVESGRCTAAVLTTRMDNPFGAPRVIRENGNVRAVADQKDLRPDQMNISEICCGVYAFDAAALRQALKQLTPDDSGDYHLSQVIALLNEAGEVVRSVPVLEAREGMGVNDRVQLAEAEKLMRNRINRRHMLQGVTLIDPDRVYIQPDVMIGRDTVIHPNCEIGRGCVIGEKCVLRAGCQVAFSKIGEGCVMGNSVVRNAVLENGVKLEHCVVSGATVKSGEAIEPFSVIKD